MHGCQDDAQAVPGTLFVCVVETGRSCDGIPPIWMRSNLLLVVVLLA